MNARRNEVHLLKNLAATSVFSAHLQVINNAFHAANSTGQLFSAHLVGSRIYHTGERYHSELRFDANSRESSDVLFVDIPRCGLSSGGMTAAKA